ncbi:MAG: response regulator [Oscillatoriales cyanobacterium C42_A2020_001]|nr:response regulator [Leptolyngbyaceae cyanobacterium C42_A2020_001]
MSKYIIMYRIAIIDDNDNWCFVMGHLLRQHHYKVSTFTDGHSFIREANKFDLALIDFSMPPRRYQVEMDGPELIQQLKRQVPDPPLTILISSFFVDDILKQAPDLCPDADAILSKNVESAELLHTIQQLLASREASPESSNTLNQSSYTSQFR